MVRIIILCLFITSNAFAASIVAKVNDTPISQYDLSNYTKMALVTSKIKPTKEQIAKLSPQILQQLIEQYLRLDAIKEAGIEVSSEQITEAIENIEQQSGAGKGSLLALLNKQGIPKSVLDDKLKADIGWFQLLNYKFGKNIEVSDFEISMELANLRRESNKVHVRLSEIFIPVGSVLQDNDIYYQVLDMIKAIKDSGDFSSYARQFSRSPTNSKGGDIGWVTVESLPKEFSQKLQMNKGEISDPIRTKEGYYVLKVTDKQNKSIVKANRDMIEANLKSKKLEQFAKKYLRDLMQQSVIEKSEI